MHSHRETFPDLGLFILIQLPLRGVMFRLRRKRTTLFPALSLLERSKPIGGRRDWARFATSERME